MSATGVWQHVMEFHSYKQKWDVKYKNKNSHMATLDSRFNGIRVEVEVWALTTTEGGRDTINIESMAFHASKLENPGPFIPSLIKSNKSE